MRPRLTPAGWLFLLAAAAGCSRAQRHPPIVLISVDTLRADHLPSYGYRGVETPGLDALARDSIRFENAYAHAPLTVPSHAALLTGLLPFANGVRDNSGFRLSPSVLTIASALKSAGYATGAAVSTFALRRDRGLASGFDFYDDETSDERPGVETAARLERWMDGVAGRPMFVFLHVYEPHTPYAPPEPFRSRYAGSPYDGEIAAADAAVGGFLEYLRKLGLYRRALVVFLSDHGEGLNDHGEDEHGVFLYREAIRVPLLVKRPESEQAGQVVAAPVGLVDVFPTLARAAGVAVPSDRTGAPLFGPGGFPSDSGRRIYSETLYPRLQLGWSDLASLTDGEHQYIEAPRPELYDLKADPGEKRDLAASLPPALREMRAALAKIPRAEAHPEKSAPGEIEKLGSLGYIHVQAGAGRALPDPKDRIDVLKDYKRLFALFYGKQDSEAVGLARRILERNPAILSVSRILALSLDRLGRTAEAESVLTGALSRPDAGGTGEDREQAAGDLATLREKHARLLLQAGKPQEAAALLGDIRAEDADGLDLRGSVLADAGRLSEARKDFVAAVAANPRHAGALFHLGALSLKEGDPASGRQWLERSLAVNPHSANTLAALGLARSALGDPTGALDAWDKALAVEPGLYDALYNRAILLGKMGRTEEARQGLEAFLRSCPPEKFPKEREEARRLLAGLASARK